MAFLEIKNVRIAGFSAGVPKQIVSKIDSINSSDYDASEFIEKTGIKEVRVSDDFTASDLCLAAAEKLLQDLGWEKESVEGIFFVSQHPDYILPATSCILQERMGIQKISERGCQAGAHFQHHNHGRNGRRRQLVGDADPNGDRRAMATRRPLFLSRRGGAKRTEPRERPCLPAEA